MNEQLFATLLILSMLMTLLRIHWHPGTARKGGGGGGGGGEQKTGSILHVALGEMLLKTLLAGRVPGLHCS